MAEPILLIFPLIAGYLLDLWLGDPDNWPHPVRVFGNAIATGEKWLNRGRWRFLKGAALSITLVVLVFLFFDRSNALLLQVPALYLVVNSIWVYYGLANHSLIAEGKRCSECWRMKGWKQVESSFRGLWVGTHQS